MSRARLWLRRGAPYLVAAFALAMIIRRYPPSAIAHEMARGRTGPLAPYAALLLIVSAFLVSAADWLVIHGCAKRPSYRVTLRGKCGAAMLNVFGYAAQAGGYGLWIARVTGMRPIPASGIVLYILSSELVAVLCVASLSMFLGGADVSPALRVGAPLVAFVLVLFKAHGALRGGPERVPAMLQPWRLLKLGPVFVQLVLRLAHIAWVALVIWLAARAFGIPLPLGPALVYLPIVLLVASLPINVAGFGAVQGAWLLLAPFAPMGGEQVIAFSILWQLCLAVGVVLRGAPFVRGVLREIETGAQAHQGAGERRA